MKPIIVVSACLEHRSCRYDGSMIKDPYVAQLKDQVNFIPLCPEMAMGLPSPREALRIIKKEGAYELITSYSGETYTPAMMAYIQQISKTLQEQKIHGFLLKDRSPSCGLKAVKVYQGHGKAMALPEKTMGVFAKAMQDLYPGLIFETEGRLKNQELREHFYGNVFARAALSEVKTMGELVAFHSNYKYFMMMYHPGHLKTLGKLVANHEHRPFAEVYGAYEELCYDLLMEMPTTGKTINVLSHIYGYFSKDLSSIEKRHFMNILDLYKQGKLPLSVPIALLYSWVLRYDNDYLKEQKIFTPYPEELISMSDSGR